MDVRNGSGRRSGGGRSTEGRAGKEGRGTRSAESVGMRVRAEKGLRVRVPAKQGCAGSGSAGRACGRGGEGGRMAEDGGWQRGRMGRLRGSRQCRDESGCGGKEARCSEHVPLAPGGGWAAVGSRSSQRGDVEGHSMTGKVNTDGTRGLWAGSMPEWEEGRKKWRVAPPGALVTGGPKARGSFRRAGSAHDRRHFARVLCQRRARIADAIMRVGVRARRAGRSGSHAPRSVCRGCWIPACGRLVVAAVDLHRNAGPSSSRLSNRLPAAERNEELKPYGFACECAACRCGVVESLRRCRAPATSWQRRSMPERSVGIWLPQSRHTLGFVREA
ncbi:hypothetical protein DFH09DRAFT_1431675 [Mycena vulgaris]|nr:hypothetical protein DFH09DRAFT_1431675 [Mycena vulgaris]